VFVVEGWMGERRTEGREIVADQQCDARIAFAAVPIAPVALDLAERPDDLFSSGFDFLETDDSRTLACDPVLDLRATRPDAVDVPGRDLQKRA
jgi:hypothetical protein